MLISHTHPHRHIHISMPSPSSRRPRVLTSRHDLFPCTFTHSALILTSAHAPTDIYDTKHNKVRYSAYCTIGFDYNYTVSKYGRQVHWTWAHSRETQHHHRSWIHIAHDKDQHPLRIIRFVPLSIKQSFIYANLQLSLIRIITALATI